MKTVKVKIPGTTANCGPGFDAVGIACTLYNELEMTLWNESRVEVDVCGYGKDILPNNEQNLAWQAACHLWSKIAFPVAGGKIVMTNRIPLSHGMGSSAAALVGGLYAANLLSGERFSRAEILDMAAYLEGHPDNVAPAVLGAMTFSITTDEGVQSLRVAPVKPLHIVVVIPEFNVATHEARQALPGTVPMKDAVYNVGRTAMLAGALCSGDYSYLRYALDDKLHQPYRASLIPGMWEVFEIAKARGALGAAISGSGSCLVAFTEINPEEIGRGMVEVFQKQEIPSEYVVLGIDVDGVRQIVE